MPDDSAYRSDTSSRGDHRAIPTSEPASYDTPITITSYGLNNPKAYIAYTVALAHTGTRDDADAVVAADIINAVADARRGAHHLDLITPVATTGSDSDEYELTMRGELVASKAVDAYGSYDNAIATFSDMKGSTERFADTHEVWATVGPYIAQADATIAYFVALMQTTHQASGREAFSLTDLTHYYLPEHDVDFTVEFFFNDRQTVRDKIRATFENGEYDVFADVDAYRATVTYQLKTLLYHFGVLTERGKDTANLDPQTDMWALTDRLR